MKSQKMLFSLRGGRDTEKDGEARKDALDTLTKRYAQSKGGIIRNWIDGKCACGKYWGHTGKHNSAQV